MNQWGARPRRGVAYGLAAVAVAVALVGASCSSDDGDGANGPTTTAGTGSTTTAANVVDEDPKLTEVDCWWELPDDAPEGTTVTCGTVEVPADRTDADTEMITLPVARIHREGSPADAEPLIYLHGGPGGDALQDAPAGLMSNDGLADRDIITFDQRGTGRSTPSLNCPEKEEAVLDALGAAGTWDEEFAANQKAVQDCYERLTGDGIDLNDYNSLHSIADMESIRAAYDVETWNVWGGSYGTRLGLAYARAHPDQVRSLVIDSVYPPEAGGVERSQNLPVEAIDRLVEACDEQASCVAEYGNLQDRLDAAVAAFDERPEPVSGDVTVGGETQNRSFLLTGPDVVAGMFAALYDSTIIPSLPGVIDALGEGDRSIIPVFVSTGVPRLIDLSEGAFYSFECADSGRLSDPDEAKAALEDPGQYALVALGTADAFCADWPVDHVPDSFNEPVDVDVPTLVYGGTLDPVTPYTESEAQAELMPDADFVSVKNGGHGVAGFDDCTRQARIEFWNDPTSELPDCVAEIEGNTFETP